MIIQTMLGGTASGLCCFSAPLGCSPGTAVTWAAVSPSPALSPGAPEVSVGNVTSLGWQGSSCQPAAFSVHVGYVSCLGLKGLIGRAAYGNELDMREGRYKVLTAEEHITGSEVPSAGSTDV